MDGSEAPSSPGFGFQVLLADGSTVAATWMSPEFSATGKAYWWGQKELEPLGWRLMEDMMMRSG